MTKRVAIYARCSTADQQTTENQILELRRVAEQHRRHVVHVFDDDDGVSGITLGRSACVLSKDRRGARAGEKPDAPCDL
jgi:DNA invertase Pin-like site-specific DNA recombinase